MTERIVVCLIGVLLAGCATRTETADQPASGLHTMEHDGRIRSYILRVPPTARAGERLPLVLVLHGGGGNGANAERMTGFTPVANAERFLVAYPEGTSRGRLRLLTWNAGNCCGYAMDSGVDDVGFIRQLIATISHDYPVDAERVFVTGMSNGGMMSHRLGIELGESIAAIAPVVGGIFGDEPAPSSRVSALMINGMLDRSVPYEGGAPGGPFADSWRGVPVQPAMGQATFWARGNGCGDAVTIESAAYTHVRFTCTAGVGVELYGMRNVGHAWPGGERGSRRGDAPGTDLDATRVIWEFFASHPKRR